MARRPRPLTEKMATIYAAIPEDGSLIDLTAIFRQVGYSKSVGPILAALMGRGLIEQVNDRWTWRRRRRSD